MTDETVSVICFFLLREIAFLERKKRSTRMRTAAYKADGASNLRFTPAVAKQAPLARECALAGDKAFEKSFVSLTGKYFLTRCNI